MNRRQRNLLRRTRKGISLIEVLMSMFILAVGLLGIASLLPIGQRQIEMADQQDRAAIIGQNAFRTFRTRGYTSPGTWMTAGGAVVDGSTSINGPIIIDPLLVAQYGSGNTIGQVPHTGTNVLARYSVRPNPLSTGTTTTPSGQLQAMAEAIFVARDDLIVKYGEKPEDATTIGLDVNARRDFEGRYSWMAMIAPSHYSNSSGNATWTPTFEMPCELSIIVFNRRPYQGAVNDVKNDTDTIGGQAIPRERAVNVTAFDGGGIGGGDITIQDTTNSYNLMVRPGEYLLLVSQDRKYARWYKILAAEDFNPPGENSRTITLSGPDWTYGNATAILFDGAVAVYTKSTKLEGPSRMN